MSVDGPVLRDIHLPPAAWWPPAPGWWIVAALVLLAASVLAWLQWRRARRHPLRAALREVDALAAAYACDSDDARLADGASRLMRRVAYMIDPEAASRSGDAWHTFLDRYARDADTKAALDHLVESRFHAHPVLDEAALLAALRVWCRNALRGNGRHAASRLGARVSSFPRRFAATPFVPKEVDARVRRGRKEAAP